MKRILFYTLLLPYFITSCSDDENKPSCPEGYSGQDCDIPFNTVFTGTWSVEDLCLTSGADEYTLTLVPSTENPREFTITGMWEEPEVITVLVHEKNKLKFSEGTQPLGNSGFTIEIRQGTINKAGDEMTIEYIIYSGPAQVESCAASCTRNM